MTLPVVTVIRRRTIYEDCVMTLEEFKNLNDILEGNDDEDQCLVLDNLNDTLEDSLVDTPRSYAAIGGDVSSHVDDIIAFDTEDKILWSDEGDFIDITDIEPT
jgi:hypothetical protein